MRYLIVPLIAALLPSSTAWAYDDQELARIERQFCTPFGSCPDWVKKLYPDAGWETKPPVVWSDKWQLPEPSEDAKALARSLADQMERAGK